MAFLHGLDVMKCVRTGDVYVVCCMGVSLSYLRCRCGDVDDG